MEPEINALKKRKMTEAPTHHLSNGVFGVGGGGRGKMQTCIQLAIKCHQCKTEMLLFKKNNNNIKNKKYKEQQGEIRTE